MAAPKNQHQPQVGARTDARSGDRTAATSSAVVIDALGEAGWQEADRALARALAEFEEVEAASTPVRRAEALMLLRQALARAARARGFSRLGGDVGEIEPYDPAAHELVRPAARPPADVMILSRGVARGGEVLVKARVRAARRTP
jgi:hypothetical protein